MEEDKTADETKKDIKLFNECIDRLKEIGNQNLSLFTNNLQQGNLNTIKFLFDKYIKRNKQLEEDNEQLDAIKNEAVRRYNFESIPVSKVKGIIEQLDERIKNPERTSYWASYTISECIGIRRILQDILGKE